MDTEVLLPDCEFHKKPFYECIKRIFDLVVSLVAVIVLSPILLVIALAIRLEDRGPILYRAQRVGRGGKPITVYKFRSMRMNADRLEDMLTPEELEEYKKNFKLEHDPRITKVGAFLRKTSLDELPQLFNILSGTLSLVGPRPVLQEETELYGDKRNLLLSCKPGLTGLWQVSGRSNVTYENGRRQALELQYVSQRSLWLDIKILFWTVGAVVRMDGAK
ncbi:MAG: sugar transferase [Oscillospiraceae bacterium]|nr:sugar transferase [Oscillospiraceae bacterium]